jgi:hypothetical protein
MKQEILFRWYHAQIGIGQSQQTQFDMHMRSPPFCDGGRVAHFISFLFRFLFVLCQTGSVVTVQCQFERGTIEIKFLVF